MVCDKERWCVRVCDKVVCVKDGVVKDVTKWCVKDGVAKDGV